MIAIRVNQKAADINALQLDRVDQRPPFPEDDEMVIEVKAAGVNPSDVKATLGAFPNAIWPRIPGRDFAGVVVDGPNQLLGREVWGCGGDLGIKRDGTHASYLALPVGAFSAKPEQLSFEEAGAVGVPFVTAYQGFVRSGFPGKKDTVLVMGADGKVGQAAIQLASQYGAAVIGVVRNGASYTGHVNGELKLIDSSVTDVAEAVQEYTKGHGADIVFNTVGSPYFQQANKSLAFNGTQIFISTIDKSVSFNIFEFYRGQHTYVGIDSQSIDSVSAARIFDDLRDGFNMGTLMPFKIDEEHTFELKDALQAYKKVMSGARERVVLRMEE